MKKLDFERRIKYNKKPLVVDLWAPWCSPCKAMEPAFKKVSRQYEGKVEVLKINADESPDVLKSLGVMSIPTTVGFANGEEILRRTGMQTESMLEFFFKTTFEQKKPAIMPPAPAARVLRTVLGIGGLVAGWFMDRSIIVMVIGGIILFSAFYDRCPIMRAVIPRIKALFSKPTKSST